MSRHPRPTQERPRVGARSHATPATGKRSAKGTRKSAAGKSSSSAAKGPRKSAAGKSSTSAAKGQRKSAADKSSSSASRVSPRHPSTASRRPPKVRKKSLRPQRKDAPRRVSAPPPKRRRVRSGKPRRRLIAALVVILMLFSAIVVRVGMLQAGDSDDLREAGVQQWARTYELSGRRGTIFDRDGNELAMSIPAASISINPMLIENGDATIQSLDDLLDLGDEKTEELRAEVTAAERGFVYVARQVDADIGEQIESLDLPGVNVDEDSRREYPGGDSARSLLGSVDIDGIGTAGLEIQYDDQLTGTDGMLGREIQPGGKTIPGSEHVIDEPVPGEDLVLTIDRSIQHIAEQLLIERVRAIPARGAQAIVMDTDTGEILAMASVRRSGGKTEVSAGNYALVEAYEPGSVAKVLTVAGGLDSGAVTPTSGFEVPWRREYYDVMLSDSHQHATEWMDVWKILVVSSNIGTIEIQRAMGSDVHHEYMQAFGWGTATNLGFPNESPGDLKPYDDMWGSEKLTTSYGQGVATTAAQLIAAINTVGNEGVYVEPKLVKATIDAEGEMTETDPSETRQVVSKQAAAQTSSIMRDVVCKGTATQAQVDGLTIAGKTGTAFKAADNGTYWTDEGTRKYFASFVGYFPAEDPQVTILVSVDEPAATNERFGGTAAAPVFADLAPIVLNELGIQPSAGGGCPEE